MPTGDQSTSPGRIKAVGRVLVSSFAAQLLQGDRAPAGGGLVQRLQRTRLRDRILSADQRRLGAANSLAQVLELEPIWIGALDHDSFALFVPAQLDDSLLAVPRIVEEARAVGPNRPELVALGQR